MKSKKMSFSVMLMLVVGSGLLQAQTNYDAPMKTITIDGDLSDWNGSEFGVLSHSRLGEGSGAPVNVEIKYAWDADNFYTLVQETTVDDDKVEGADAGDWVSGPAAPDGSNTGPAAPWGTDSVGFYDGDRQLGEEMQWWIGLSSDDEQRHLRREAYEDDSTTLLIEDQSANNVTDGKRAVEFFMPWAKIRDDESFAFHTPGHTLQDLAVGYSFRLDPLLVDGVGDGSEYKGQAFPGGETGPLAVAEADWSIVVLADAPMGGGTTGDFNGDGTFDCADVNALAAAVGSADASFDMNGDGNVTLDDITEAGSGWLTVAGAANTAVTSGNPFIHGDENLDGTVDSSDLGLLLNNFGADSGAAYCGGDLDANGAVDSSDLGLLLNNFNSAAAAAVPEPGSLGLMVFAVSGLLLVRRRRR